MAIGDNNEKYYAPTVDYKESYSPTTYASNDYSNITYSGIDYADENYYDGTPKTPTEQAMTEAYAEEKDPNWDREAGHGDPNPPSGIQHERTADNNYGYESLGLLGDVMGIAGTVIGGPVGMIAKGPKALSNIASQPAVAAARKDLGLKEKDEQRGVLASAIKGPETHVATVQIGDAKYNVDVNPDKQGKIDKNTGIATISPKEMQKIEIDNKIKAVEVDAPEAPAEKKGVLGEAVSNIGKSLGLQKDKDTPTVADPAARQDSFATPGYNPDAPSPASPTQNVGFATRPDNPANISTQTSMNKGFAPGFSPAVDTSKTNATPTGKGRYAAADEGLMATLQDSVAKNLGPQYGVSVTSGTYSQAQINSINEARDNAYGQAKAKGLSEAAAQKAADKAGKQAGQIGSTRHTSTYAADVQVTKDGKVVNDPEVSKAAVLGFAKDGITGLGYGKGYMGVGTIHADMATPSSPGAWGAGGKAASMKRDDPELYSALQTEFADTKAVQQNLQTGLAQYQKNTQEVAPTPVDRQEALDSLNQQITPADQLSNLQSSFVSPSVTSYSPSVVSSPSIAEVRTKDDNINAMVSRPDVADPTDNVTESTGLQTTSDMSGYAVSPGLASMNVGYTPGTAMSPANFGSIGMGMQMSPSDIGLASMTISGEISPQERAALANPEAPGYQNAVNAVGSVLGVMQNRFDNIKNVVKDNPVEAAITAPSQFSALNPGMIANTQQAYAKDGVNVTNTVKGLLDGTLTAQNPAAQETHYANFSEANPGWGKTAEFGGTAVTVGAHTFGTPDQSQAPSGKGYGLGYGPAAAVGVTGMSGQTHAPGAMFGGMDTAGTVGNQAAAGTNALGGGLGLGGGYVDGGTATNTGEGESSTNTGLGGTSSSANGNTGGLGGASTGGSSSSSGNGNTGGSGSGSDGASSGGTGSAGGSSAGGGGSLGGRSGGDKDGGDRGR